jgi:hypothetical protein
VTRVVLEIPVELGGDDELVAQVLGGEEFAERCFGIPLALSVGGIDEIEAVIERGAERLVPVIERDIAPELGRKLPAPETDARDIEIGLTELSVLHGRDPRSMSLGA